MIERLSSENQTTQLAAQFVPLKIDTASDEWRSWVTKYPYDGRSIPIVFVVRADGEKIYAKSGSLPRSELPQLLSNSLSVAGTMLTERQLNDANKALEQLKKAQESNDWAEIGKSLRLAKRVGPLGAIGSYAQVASDLDKSISELGESSMARLKKIESAVADESLGEDDKVNLAKIFLLAKNELGKISSLNPEISRMLKSIERSPSIRQTIAEVKSSGVPITRESVVDIDTVSSASSVNSEDRKTNNPNSRTWISHNGRFSINAELKGVDDGKATLLQENGETVMVTVSRLSKEDQKFIQDNTK